MSEIKGVIIDEEYYNNLKERVKNQENLLPDLINKLLEEKTHVVCRLYNNGGYSSDCIVPIEKVDSVEKTIELKAELMKCKELLEIERNKTWIQKLLGK